MSLNDQDKITMAREYFIRADQGRPDILELFHEEAEIYFPKFGYGFGRQTFFEMVQGFAGSLEYIQHSAHIEPGREGLFNLVKSLPPTLKYEPGTIVADGDFVIVHGRFSGFQPVNWIAADILRIKDGILVEHWDVIQDEATQEQSKSGNPMFGNSFPGNP